MEPFCELSYSELDGWFEDRHEEALEVFLKTSFSQHGDLSSLNLNKSARYFFEKNFVPTLLRSSKKTLFTGYFESEVFGSLVKDDEFKFPIYKKPLNIKKTNQWFSRREIEEESLLINQNLEIVFLRNELDLFFLHVQGSGRVLLKDGSIIRVGYDGKNGHKYISIGKILINRGVFDAKKITQKKLKDWIFNNPKQGNELLLENPSYIFFKVLSNLVESEGPMGTMETPLTPLRSLAVDPNYIPLGAPVWIEKEGDIPLRQLMIAQDTGSAIKGSKRADIFYGTGKKAEELAGNVVDLGRMIILKQRK
ncbi:MAG: MltA domain-containing protein [Paracoccaceae bacterium]|nr:MltA domain-containing protein [Paracoccaceae bacterium]